MKNKVNYLNTLLPFILFRILFFYGCMHRKSPPNLDEEIAKNNLQYELDSIDFSRFRLNGLPIILNLDTLLMAYGQPDSIRYFHCKSLLEIQMFNEVKSDSKRYPFAWLYFKIDHTLISYVMEPEALFLHTISFDANSDIEFKFDDQHIAYKSTTELFSKLFPTSYKFRLYHHNPTALYDILNRKYVESWPVTNNQAINGMYLNIYFNYYKDKLIQIETQNHFGGGRKRFN